MKTKIMTLIAALALAVLSTGCVCGGRGGFGHGGSFGHGGGFGHGFNHVAWR